MAFPRLKQFAAKKNWEIVKNTAYGEEQGYLFTLVDGSGFKLFATPLPQISEENKKKILDNLTENKKQLKINRFEFNRCVLIVYFKEAVSSTKVETMEYFLEHLKSLLKELGLKGAGCCIFCEQDGADQSILIDGIMYSAHNECFEKEATVIEEATQEFERVEKNYFVGFIGALLGGIIGAVPWILVQVFLNRIVAALAVIIGLAAFKGYTLMKGLLGPMTRWIIAFSTIVAVVLAQYISLGIEMFRNEVPITLENYSRVLKIPEVAGSFRANLGLSLIMAFLGMIGIIISLKGNAESFLPSMRKK